MEAAGARVVVMRPAPFDFAGPGFVPEFNWGLAGGGQRLPGGDRCPGALAGRRDRLQRRESRPVTRRGARTACATASGVRWASGRRAQIARDNREQARAYLTDLLDGNELDVLVGIDTLQSLIYPFAGFPAIAVPAGPDPVACPFSVTFIGRPRADAELIGHGLRLRAGVPAAGSAAAAGWRGPVRCCPYSSAPARRRSGVRLGLSARLIRADRIAGSVTGPAW